MKLRAAFVVFIALVVSCSAQTFSPPSASNESAESFVRTIIQHEARGSKADEEAQAGERGAKAIYTPKLLALIRRDRNSTPRGYVGKLDWDPLCACQDTDGLTLSALKIVPTSSTSADVLLTLHFSEPKDEKITYHLLLTPAGWRIDDIGTKDVPSLRKLLE